MTEYMTGFLHGMLVLALILWAVGYYIWYKFKRKMMIMIEQEQAEEDEVLTKVVANVAMIEGHLYCYNDNNEFICQGVTLNDLTEAYKARYPDKPSCVLLLKGEPELIDKLSREYSDKLEKFS
jgi:hypothetical protein